MRQISRAICLSLALLAVEFSLGVHTEIHAQAGATTANISGVVTDEQGAVISGANISIKSISTNLVREVLTGETGSYQILQLPPGRYEVKVTVDGFKTQNYPLELEIGTNVSLNPSLKLGDVAGEVIEITGSNTLQSDKTESSTNQDKGRIDNLPINQRNFLDFALTSPRVTVDRLPPNGTTSTSGLSFNGQSARLNNVTVDGNSNNEEFTGGVRSTFSQEAVQEFQIVSDSYSAEFGRAVGGVVNIVTRSGSNEIHGTVFNFIRNDSLSARDAFAPSKPEFEQYQFGATIGGPIKKDRAFFFASFERLSVKQNQIVTIPDNIITSARRQGFPEVSSGAIPFAVGTSNFLARADFIISPKDRLVVRYNGGFKYDGAFETIGAFSAGLQSPTTSGIQRLDENTLNINNSFFTGNLVNETRFLFNTRDQVVESADPGQPLVLLASQVGQVTFGNNFLTPQDRFSRAYQIVNTTSIQSGRSFYKFGIDFNYTNLPDNRSSFFINNFGSYFFVPLDFTGLGGPFLTAEQSFDPLLRSPQQRVQLGALAQGLTQVVPGFPLLPLADIAIPGLFSQVFGNARTTVDQKSFSAFFQDEIKVRPNFLLKAGIRYDVFRETNIPTNSGNFAPRVALSYSPGILPKLNVRASYGIFFGGAPPLQLAFILGVYPPLVNNSNPPAINQFFPFPFSLFSFNLPGKRFPALPNFLPVPPQLSQTFEVQPDLRAPYSHQATLGFNYSVDPNTKLTIEYNFVRGIKLYSNRFINPVVRPVPGNPFLGSLTGRVDTTKGLNYLVGASFDSYYHGLTLLAQRRLTKRVSFLVSYTFSKAIDNYFDFRTDLQGEDDPLKPGNERGLSVQDIRNRFIASGIWNLDYTKNPFLRDFQLSIITDLSSGRPFNLTTGADTNMNFESVPLDRPSGLARNAGLTPGFASVDLRVTRNFIFKEQTKFQVTFEAFNLFNRVNISAFNNVFPVDQQGRVNLPPQENGRFIVTPDRFTNAFRPRQLQVGFRFVF